MSKKVEKTPKVIEEKIISFVSANQPVHIGEIFKTLRISQTKGLPYVISMINNGKLCYNSHNQVNV